MSDDDICMVARQQVRCVDARCVSCGRPFMWGANVYSEAGRREVAISGLCERCFDDVTAEPDE